MGRDQRQFQRITKRVVVPFHKKKKMVLQGPKSAGELAMWLKGPRSECEILDISKGGVRVQTNADLEKGDPVLLVMKFSTYGTVKEVDGIVVRVNPAEAGSGSKFEVGIQFSNLTQAAADMLDRLIREEIALVETQAGPAKG